MHPEQYLALPDAQPTVPFIDLSVQQDHLRPILEHNLHTVLHHGGYIMGPEVKKLERSLAEYAGMGHCISCASGTDALQLALMALAIGPGDAVFVPAFTFMASAEVVSLLGAEPRFVDIDPLTFNMDPRCLESAILECLQEGKVKPRCVMPVDLFGLPADYPALRALADRFGLTILADSAQGFGATMNGVMACQLAHITATSFFPSKPLGCYGDGGAIFTSDANLAETMASLRVHGKGADKYDNVRIGINSRLDTIQAAVLQAKLTRFPQELTLRRQVAAQYSARLAPHARTPYTPSGLESTWAQYGIVLKQRDQVEKQLRARRIPTAVYYPKALPFQTAYAHLGDPAGRFPVAEEVSRQILHLPMHADLVPEEIERISVEVIQAIQTCQQG
ncbi:MAG: DegT/DnrJ/EryC1/StrS family aminotransferase [Magnetococcales bacterium]|nr:DegT/DnrJ/EryC1/StrS family aminotransferase [Magnetococcales bacterium]